MTTIKSNVSKLDPDQAELLRDLLVEEGARAMLEGGHPPPEPAGGPGT